MLSSGVDARAPNFAPKRLNIGTAGACLVASADAEPDQLYTSGGGAKLFERTASRLLEMRSQTYLAGRGG